MPELRSQTQREYYLLVFLRCLSRVNFYAFIVSTYRLINFNSIYLSLFQLTLSSSSSDSDYCDDDEDLPICKRRELLKDSSL